MLVVHVPTNGDPRKVEIPDDNTLQGLHDLVGGFIEIVRPRLLPSDWVFVVDDEGKLKDYPVNVLGTILYDSPWDTINGDLVLVREGMVEDEEGYMVPDLIGLTEAEADDCINRFIPKALYYSDLL